MGKHRKPEDISPTLVESMGSASFAESYLREKMGHTKEEAMKALENCPVCRDCGSYDCDGECVYKGSV